MADEELNTLSSAFIAELRSALQLIRQQRRTPTGRSADRSLDHQDFPTVFAYICRTPVDGIPAISLNNTGTAADDSPGYADDVPIYRIILQRGGLDATGTGITGTGTGVSTNIPLLEPVVGLSHRVYNLSDCDIPGSTWIPIIKDGWGSWLAVAPADCAGGSTTCGAPGYDECYKRILDVRVSCVGSSIVTQIDVEYVRRCKGRIFSVGNTPCPVPPCTTCPGGSPGDTLYLFTGTITNDGCTDCASAGGTITLTRTPGCQWESDPFTLCGEDGCSWQAFYTAEASQWQVVLIRPTSTSRLTYVNNSSPDCSMPVTLDKTLEDGCIGEMTVVLDDSLTGGGGSASTCSECTADPGTTISLDTTGITDGLCSDCVPISTLITLARTTAPGGVTAGCYWESATFTLCGAAGGKFTLSYVGNTYTLKMLTGSSIEILNYSLTGTTGDCSLPKTLNVVSGSTDCTGPSTLTIS